MRRLRLMHQLALIWLELGFDRVRIQGRLLSFFESILILREQFQLIQRNVAKMQQAVDFRR
ncbi:MAG: hypothetical protein JWM11_861 [Planctomycetaceae bacterium]|nr:hypothetical protein [Planctomycetaceae bacterium]